MEATEQVKAYLKAIGSVGGSRKSARKTLSNRRNAQKPRGPHKSQSEHVSVLDTTNTLRSGLGGG